MPLEGGAVELLHPMGSGFSLHGHSLGAMHIIVKENSSHSCNMGMEGQNSALSLQQCCSCGNCMIVLLEAPSGHAPTTLPLLLCSVPSTLSGYCSSPREMK